MSILRSQLDIHFSRLCPRSLLELYRFHACREKLTLQVVAVVLDMESVQAQGYNGSVTFNGALLTIERKGLAARALIGSGSKSIPVTRIAGVQFVPAKLGFRGFIQFTVPGGIESRATFGHRTKAAAHDENSVMFNRHQQPEFETVRDAVMVALADISG